MDDLQSSAKLRVSNGPLLYPILKSTVPSAPEQFGLILPSINDLHLPMNKAVDAQTRTQTTLSGEP